MYRLFRSLAFWPSVLWLTVALLVALVVSPAFAASASTVVDLSPFVAELRGYLTALALVLINAGLAFLVRYFLAGGTERSETAKKVALEIEGMTRDFLHSTADRGITLAFSKLGEGVNAVDMRSQIAADVVGYVQRQAPDALKRLNATPEALGRLVQAKLSEVLPLPGGGAAQSDFVFSAGAVHRAG